MSHYLTLILSRVSTFQAIVEKYETVRRVQGGLVDRLDQCVSALLLAQPSMYPETPTAEKDEAIKRLDAHEQEAVVSRPASGRHSGKVGIDVHFALNFTCDDFSQARMCMRGRLTAVSRSATSCVQNAAVNITLKSSTVCVNAGLGFPIPAMDSESIESVLRFIMSPMMDKQETSKEEGAGVESWSEKLVRPTLFYAWALATGASVSVLLVTTNPWHQ